MYDFAALSPLDFEELVRDLLQACWNRKLESFGPGKDRGIDLRYLNGPEKIIIQAKHYARSGPSALLRAMASERPKAIALAPSRYIVATSVSMTPGLKDQILAAVSGVPLVESDILGREALDNLLSLHPEVLRKHFKLWLASTEVLERILLSGVYNRTAAELDQIKEMIPKFVQNSSVGDAETLLEQTGALIISGAPGVGKTTLARILLWRHAEQGWQIYVVDDVEEALKVANEGQKRLIFFDDFLGQVQLSAEHVRGIDARLPPLLQRVAAHKELRFILTTRDYILAQAKTLSQRLERPTSTRSYVLNVGTYTRAVRARILYNHLYFSTLSPKQRDAILADNFFLKMIDHKNFNPRLIDMLTRTEYLTMTDRPVRDTILHALNNPQELWERPFRHHMSNDARLLLLAMAINGAITKPILLRASFQRVAIACDAGIMPAEIEPRFRAAYREVEGSALGLTNGFIQFVNPGLRDFLNNVIDSDNLLKFIVPQVATATEFRECIALLRGRRPRDKWGDGAAWIVAYDRLVQTGAADQFQRIELVLDLYDMFLGDQLLARVEAAAANLEDVGFGYGDISEACSLLERTAATLLPSTAEERVRQIVSDGTASMIQENAGGFSIEDIQSLDKALEEYGIDPERTSEAMYVALDVLAGSVDDNIDEIDTLEGLDEFEDSLFGFMRRHSYPVDKVERKIERRRDNLREDSYVEPEHSYRGGGPSPAQYSISDDQIRSMFSGLEP